MPMTRMEEQTRRAESYPAMGEEDEGEDNDSGNDTCLEPTQRLSDVKSLALFPD